MRPSKYALIVVCLSLCAACAGAEQSVPTSLPLPSVSPTPNTSSAPASAATPMSTGERLLSVIPPCVGIEVLDQPVKFAWPNVEQRLKDLEGSGWGYYRCPRPMADVSAFYREQMLKPPYNMDETNWVERAEGTLGIYYNSASQTWIYMWVVPQSSDAQSSYVIVALALGEAFEPEC